MDDNRCPHVAEEWRHGLAGLSEDERRCVKQAGHTSYAHETLDAATRRREKRRAERQTPEGRAKRREDRQAWRRTPGGRASRERWRRRKRKRPT